ncbi:MAG: gamma-glutamyl-gamma-aminobutyrate hydrolase family protein, partial [Lachnospiraceae bacterium]|nr:gamma-glutamyl-gamma-aminobutyrate hydrolase family protein [Lachnospiraceae bacterium]
GMITAIKYARENNIPYLGLCLGMQLAIVEFARDVAGLEGANSIEFDAATKHPVIALLPDHNAGEDIGGTLRLGSYPCVLEKGSLAHSLYKSENITERHRHRYEVNNDYRDILKDNGLRLCGLSPDNRIVEMIEYPKNDFFVATQAHPEFKSRPNAPHPLFAGFVAAATKHKK